MPYAAEGKISTSPIAGGIEITDQQYAQALSGMAAGQLVSIDGGFAVIDPPEPEVPPAPEPEPPGPPTIVTRAQGKAALIQAGLWGNVVAYVDGIEDPTEQALARVALDDTTHWQRDSPFLNAAAAALGLTEQQLDDLFVAAAAIVL